MKWWLILLSMTLVMFFNATVRDTTWNKSTRGKFVQLEKAKKLPQKRLFDLDAQALADQLKRAPKRSFNKKNISDVVISLPNADGSVEDYKVFENSVMPEQLAQKYPRIKSYLGVSAKNPRVRVYFTQTPLGFKAMKRNPDKSTEYIEPVSSDLQTYTVYQSTEMIADGSFSEEKLVSSVYSSTQDTSTQRMASQPDSLRVLRLAIATDGETSQLFGNTKEYVLSGIAGLVTRLNAIFENDLGVRVILVPNNDELLFMDGATDPYSGVATNLNSEMQNTLNAVVGLDNYDIGHLIRFTGSNVGAAGGLACIATKGLGYSTSSAQEYDGDKMLQVLAHEMGHQMGANHSFTSSGYGGGLVAGMEPGKGAYSSIMSYAQTGNAFAQYSDGGLYYHAVSIMQIAKQLEKYSCGTIIQTGNLVPSADAGLDYMIPKLTPFVLQGYGSDANAEDVLTYSWEQMDGGIADFGYPTPSQSYGPMFRSYGPRSTPIRYFPNMDTVLAGQLMNSEYTCAGYPCEVLSDIERDLNFRLTVRDNRIGGASTNSDDMVVKVNPSAGPFMINSANTLVGYQIGSVQTISWNVAGTNANGINCSSVDIFLSTDGGKTFPITLAAATPNDGSENITIPNMPGDKNRIMIKGTNHIFFDVNNSNFSIYLIADSIAPSAPANLSVDEIGTTYATITWSSSTDNIGVIAYDVFQNGSLKYSTSGTALRVSAGSSYYIKARDAAGNYSLASNVLYVTNSYSGSADGIPTAAVVAATAIGSKSVTLEWSGATDDVGIKGYDIYQNDVLIKKIEAKYTVPQELPATNFVVPGLLPATTYQFFVVAYDEKFSRSPRSNLLSVTTFAADTVAPSVPVLSYSSLTASKIKLSWTAATDNIAVKEYDVYVNGILRVSVNSTFVDLIELKPATNYSFSVFAKDASGNKSLASNVINVTTLADTTPPTAPVLSYSNLSSTTAILTFANSTDDCSIQSKLTYQLSGSSNGSISGSFTMNLTGLIPGNTYSYTIRTKDEAGNYSAPSNTITFTTRPASVSAPSAPVLTMSGLSMNSLKLSWSASTDDTGIANYSVYQNGTLSTTQVGTSFIVGMLLPGTSYSFYVVAKDVDGNVTSSNTLQVTTPADALAPVAPFLSYTKRTASSVELNWAGASDNVGVSGFEVYQNGSLITSGTASTYTATGLLPATTYNFYVAVKDAAGNKTSSNIVSVVTMGAAGDTTPPTSPVLSYSSVTNSTVKISWTGAYDNNGISYYRIYKNGAHFNTSYVANYNVMGLSPATTYSFYVVAVDAAGNTSPVNNTITFTTLAATADTMNPMPPSLSASSITTSSVNLSWSGATDNFGVVGYDVYQNGVFKVSTTAITLAVSGLSNLTKYNFYVVAKDAAGNKSAPSGSVFVTTLTADSVVPTAPTLSYSTVTASSVQLSWSGATDNVGVTGYDIYKNGVLMSSTSSSMFSVGSLSPSTTYSFYVVAKDAAGNRSVSSNTVSVTTLAASDIIAPTAPNLSSSSVTTSSVQLSWSASSDNVGVVGYDVYQNGVFKSSVTGTSLAISGLSASTAYSFSVKAKDAAGNVSASSNVVSVTTLSASDVTPPSAPVLSSSGLSSSSVNLSWSASSDNVGVVGYEVYQNGVFKSSVTGTSLAISGLSASTAYSFSVKAKDAAGNVSASSNVVSVTTLSASDVTPPSAPVLAASGTTKTTTNLSWSVSSDNVGVVGYDVYQNGVFKASVTGTSYTVTGLMGNKTYTFYVKAKDAAGNVSASSNVVSVKTPRK